MAQKEQRLRPGVARPAGQSVALSWDGTPMEVPKPTVGERILRRFGGKNVPSTVGKRPLPDIELDGEPANLDAGAGMVWEIIGLERSDDYKFGATMKMVGGFVVRGDFALEKMGDGSWLPLRRVRIEGATHAVRRARFYLRRLFGAEPGPPFADHGGAPEDLRAPRPPPSGPPGDQPDKETPKAEARPRFAVVPEAAPEDM